MSVFNFFSVVSVDFLPGIHLAPNTLRSRDGITFSNLTIGAFGPVIRFSNGTYWHNAYIERPMVLQDPAGVPVAFYGGLGRATYEDSCSWAQYFCREGQQGCGPTFPPPAPPPPPPARLSRGGLCLVTNASFPCFHNSGGQGCPVFMGACSDPTALWTLSDSTVASAHYNGTVLDIDCGSCVPNTIVKLLDSTPAKLVLDAKAGQVQVVGCPGMCLNGGQGRPNPPCAVGHEDFIGEQIKLAACSSPDTLGWTLLP